MTALTDHQPGTWNPFRYLPKLFERGPFASREPEHAHEAALQRRELILEMMQGHPDAFQSDLDVQYLMQFYPSRF
ncbi:hypothetical protein [Aestuariivita boseongensis]|uniref:hypothetical protein n=1 Tax=Aestuariivita boseongensis TaxID=1470562 RepID=UPI00068247E6|nr:hypothetical protein [Aestuariivita boseongensis]